MGQSQVKIAPQINIRPLALGREIARLQLLIWRARIIARAIVVLDNAQEACWIHFLLRPSWWRIALLAREEALFLVCCTGGKGFFDLADFVRHSLPPENVDFFLILFIRLFSWISVTLKGFVEEIVEHNILFEKGFKRRHLRVRQLVLLIVARVAPRRVQHFVWNAQNIGQQDE